MADGSPIADQTVDNSHYPPPGQPPPGPYQPQDAVAETIKAGAITGGAGLFISAIQNTLTKQNVGALAVFTRTGGTIGTFAAMGGLYEFCKIASANLREKEDVYNSTIGGFFAGSVLGFRYGSLPAVVGYGGALAIIIGTFTYSGNALTRNRMEAGVDEVSRKEQNRTLRRRPIQETIHFLGEGRGIYGPGYEERRAERIKNAYGIDVTKVPQAVGPPETQGS